MAYLGQWQIDDLLTFPANTHTAATGAATDADAPPDYRVYEDETATPILTGSMALLDSANTVGFYSEQITLSAANGFEVGKSYTIYITATVATVVGTMSHTFQVEAAPATASAVATLQTSVDDLPTNAELATSQAAADDATLAAIAALNNLSAAQVNAEVDTAITDAALATAANLATVDTVVDAIKVVTDALTSAAATKLALSAGTIVVGAAIAGTLSTTAMTTNLTEATNDHFNGRIIIWTAGVLINQATDITDYDGATKMLTFTAVTEAPTAGDAFIII